MRATMEHLGILNISIPIEVPPQSSRHPERTKRVTLWTQSGVSMAEAEEMAQGFFSLNKHFDRNTLQAKWSAEVFLNPEV